MRCDDGVIMPRRSTTDSAGYDFYAPCDIVLEPGKDVFVDTGVRFDGTEQVMVQMLEPVRSTIPNQLYECRNLYASRWAMQLIPRSGLGSRYGVRFLNTVGLIDMDYRDTIKATMTCDRPITIRKGDRFMQGVFVPVGVLVGEIEPHDDRRGGHGSTGNR